MVKLDTHISDDLNRKWKERIYKSYGIKRDSIRNSIEAAISLWITTEEKRKRETGH